MVAFSVKELLQPPLQPAKLEPLCSVALSWTAVPLGNCAWHEVPQLMPGGLDCTVPMPLPARLIVSVRMPPSSVTLPTWLTYAVVPLALIARASGPDETPSGEPLTTAPVVPSRTLIVALPLFATYTRVPSGE